MVSILIVDDDLNIRNTCQRLFQEQGHHTQSADSVRAALIELERTAYDIILLDTSIDFKVRGGSTLIDILKSDYPLIRRVAFTGQQETVFDPLAKELYNAIVCKPASLQRLYEAMGISQQ